MERGMVTAELAVAIPSVVLVLALCLVAVKAAVDQIPVRRRRACREPSRGPRRRRAGEGARARLGATGALVQVDLAGGHVRVTVSARTGGWGALPGWDLSASAVTTVESAPDEGDASPLGIAGRPA